MTPEKYLLRKLMLPQLKLIYVQKNLKLNTSLSLSKETIWEFCRKRAPPKYRCVGDFRTCIIYELYNINNLSATRRGQSLKKNDHLLTSLWIGDITNLMIIKYSSHSVDRILQRKISTKDVELVLSEPDGKIKQSQDKFLFYKKLKGRKDNLMAAVTVLRAVDTFEVVTVMINFEVK